MMGGVAGCFLAASPDEDENGRVKSPIIPQRLTALLTLGLLALQAPLGRAVDAPPAAPAATPPANAALLPPLPASALTPAVAPAAVAIVRPSEAEIAKAKEALAKLVAQADPATKALVGKYLMAVHPPRANPLLTPALSPQHRQKHANNVARVKQGPIDLMFMGDSITDGWRDPGPNRGREVFQKYYGHLRTANFGIGGDTVQGVLYRLRDGEGEGYQPKAIMLMIGTNNSGSSSSAEIAEGVGAIVLDMRTRFPAAKILLLGIFPRGDPGLPPRTTVLNANPIIAKLHDGKNVFYMDIGDKFLAADGSIPTMSDKLHPNAAGYEIWAAAVKDKLDELMK
jgi:lysophospholipase L1-like esterase